jgi:ribonuclease J
VARIRAVADAARKADREIVVVGRAMDRVTAVARETGYLEGVQPFRGIDVYGHLPPDKVVALCTGSQGEARAALARIAADEHPEVALSKGDRVIFSSRPIPGNEKAIGRVINGLIDQGVEVITDRTHLVHVSGHPRQDELKDMIGWVRPKTVIPVHGEALHLAEHAALARKLGASTLMCRNGDLVRLAPGAPEIVDEVPAGRIYKDGSLLIAAETRTVADRKRLSYSGMIAVALVMNDKGVVLTDPEVELIGIPDNSADGEPMTDVAYDAVTKTLDTLPKPRRRDPDSVEEAVRRGVRSAVGERWGKKPNVTVHVLIV